MKPILLFDIDNTLINRDRAFKSYVCDLMGRYPSAFESSDGEDVLTKILVMDEGGRRDRQTFCQDLLTAFPGLDFDWEGLWKDHQSLVDFIPADPRVASCLEDLSKGYTLGIASNGGALQRRKLNQAGLTQFFAGFFISGEMGCEKPDPRFFEKIHKDWGVKPLVMIGDDYGNDILGAKGYGLKAIWVNPNSNHDRGEADALIPSVHGVKEALDCIL